jgi:signal transduction histidine kinase
LLREAQADAQGASEKGGLRERTGEAATRLEQVLAIVADVVDMGRGRLRRSITQVSVADLTGQVVERLQHAALAHGCSLSLQVNDEVAKPVSLDADTYGRLVYLLVGWQIVQHPGHALLVSLDVSTDAAGTPQLTLDVDALEAQSASAQASPGSVGEAGGALALLLGRRLVEHMHGTLQAHNTRGESSATIRLPLLAA